MRFGPRQRWSTLAAASIMGVLIIGAGWEARAQEPTPVTPETVPPPAGEAELLPVAQPERAAPADSNWVFGDSDSIVPIRSIQDGRFWGSAEYLLWWMQPGHTPPLVTTGPGDQPLGGALGQPGTQTVFGGNLNSMLNGGRLTGGAWLDDSRTMGLEATYFYLGGGAQNYFGSSSDAPGAPVLARPFFNPITNMQDRELISGNVSGSTSSTFQGAGLNFLCYPCYECCCCPPCTIPTGYTIGYVGGVNFFRLTENLSMTENLDFTLPDPVTGNDVLYSSQLRDRFSTSNNFVGPSFGVRAEWYRGYWFVNGTSQLSLGVNHETVNIQGSTPFFTPPPPSGPFPGGFLALPTNIGSYSRNVFAAVPMISLNVGRQITQNFRLFVGYSFLYFSNVVRPGDQIDPVLNLTQLPSASGPGMLVGPARPAFSFHDTGMWVQGVNFGVQFVY